MIVVDTNVASELMKPEPSPVVADWLRRKRLELYTTSITLAEIEFGIERLPDGRRKEMLRATAVEVFARFEERVLPFDVAAAMHYAKVKFGRERAGSPIAIHDAQIAAVCRAREARLATRNVKDFEDTGIGVIDPWQPPGHS